MSRKTPTQSLISATDIREDVLNQSLGLFFGNGATYEVRTTRDRGTAYLISSSSGIAATQAIVESLRAASRRADENDKPLYKTPSIPRPPPPSARSSDKTPFPPRRQDSYQAKSEFRHHASDPQSAFSPRSTSTVASPLGGTPSHYDNPVNERPKDYSLFPKNEEDDSPQQSAQSLRLPRHDSIQQTAQAAGPKHASAVVDPQGRSGAVPIRQPYGIGQDHYQGTSESHFRSRSRQRADIEARHKPEVPQARHPLLPSPTSHLDPNPSEQPYGGSYSAPTAYLPGHTKTQSDFEDFRDWQKYQRERKEYEERRGRREDYELERPAEPQRTPVSKYDEGYETPPPAYSGAEPRQYKPRQPSPGTYGQKRQPSPDTYGQNRGHKQDRHTGYYR